MSTRKDTYGSGERRGQGRILPLLALLPLLLPLAGCQAGASPALPEHTPLEANGFQRLTTHQELVEFVQALGTSPRIEVESLGTSIQGRDIPYLKVGLGAFGADPGKVTALFFAQQHGNEPSGKEGALAFALELARGEHDALLEHVDLLLVPMLNPDGAEADERQNADGVDLNRSHLILDGVEVEALRELFHRWEPEVAVDIHQYYPWSGAWLDHGWLRLFDVQVGLPTNLNTDPEIRRLAEEGFLPFVEEVFESRGFTTHNYMVGSPDLLRWSTSNVNDGRQGFAILHTLSFIFEGRRAENQEQNLERRAAGQRLAQEALLRFAAERREDVLAVVREARARARAGAQGPFVLTMTRERSPEPLRIPVEQAVQEEDGWVVVDTVTASIDNFYPGVVAGRTTRLPDAYLVPGEQQDIIRLLERHRVEMARLVGGETLEVERLRITGFTTEDLVETSFAVPELERERATLTASAGDVLVPTSQLRGILVATALEPQSMHSLLRYGPFSHMETEGPFPVMRVFNEP